MYFALTIVYSLYLNNTQKTTEVFSCAPITKTVTDHSKYLVELFGYQVFTQQNTEELSMKFLVNQKYVVKIVEGCSGIGIIILFLSFIIAFKGKLKTALFFGASGVIIIYLVNILRIVFLVLASYHYPEFQEVLHDLVFPAIIYGTVFLLWFVWVNKYALLNNEA